MKTIRPILSALAALAVLAVLGACAQIVAPRILPGGNTGQVHLTLSTGPEGAARTILPTETPDFSRYELDFTQGGTTVPVSDPSDLAGAGIIQELETGTWIATVKAYRRFTPSGGSDTEYLAARGSADVTVAAGQLAAVTVPLTPISITDTAVKGIFTYTVSYPYDVSTATLTLSGGTTITKTLTSEETVSLEVDPGYYDLTISLTNWNNITAGASEKVHIYSGLESAAVYAFTDADFARTLRLEGTVTLPGGASISAGTIGVYSDSSYNYGIHTAAIPAGGTAWATNVPTGYYLGNIFYFKLDVFGSDGNMYTATGDTGSAVTATGMKGITLGPASQVTPTSLSYNDWTEGDLAKGQVDWYTVTVGTAGTYSLQWDNIVYGTNTYSAYAWVSAYRADGSPIFTEGADGYTTPRSLTLSAGETVYVMVTHGTGTYAIQYYNPSALPPQATPSNVQATGLPSAAGVIAITWGYVSGVTGYEVFRSDSELGTYDPIGTAPNVYSPSYTDTNVTAGVTYWYKVKAVNTNGPGPDSAALSGALSETAPATLPSNTDWATGNLTMGTQTDWYMLTAGAAGIYFLQWDDHHNGAGSYPAYVRVSAYRADGTPVFLNDGNSGYIYPQSLTLGEGESIYVMVVPQDSWNLGAYALRYYNSAALPPQTAPSVQAEGLPPPISAVAIIWSDYYSKGTAASYTISRSTTKSGTYTPIGTVVPDDDNYGIYFYIDTNVTADDTYWYKVKTVNDAGNGPDSDAVNGILPTSTPTSLSLTYNTWAEGNLTTGAQVDLYTLTAGTAGTYSLQWDDGNGDGGTGAYSGVPWVSVYRANRSPVFTAVGNGYTDPRSFTLSAGETVYVMAKPIYNITGTYAIRYYR
jgi:hypothetical protein